MKRLIFIAIMIFAAAFANAQGKPSQWSAATKDAVSVAIGHDVTQTQVAANLAAIASIETAIEDTVVATDLFYLKGNVDAKIDSVTGLIKPDLLKGLNDLGADAKALSVAYYAPNTYASHSLSDGYHTLMAIYIPTETTITGVHWIQVTAGDYTSDNYNGVTLYSVSGTTLTLVASSTNDGAIWTGTSLSRGTKAFTTPYVAAAGVYYVGMVMNRDVTTTAPFLGCTDVDVHQQLVTGNANKFCFRKAATTAEASISAAALTVYNEIPFLWLY